MKLLLLFALILPYLVLSQADSFRWALSPEVAFGASFQANEEYFTYGSRSWSTGLKITNDFKRMNGGLSTGIYFSSRSQRMEKVKLPANHVPGTNGVYDTIFGLIQEKQLMEVPLMYTVRDKVLGFGKLRTYADCGFAASVYMNDKKDWTAKPLDAAIIPGYRTNKTKAVALGGKFLVHAGLVYPFSDKLWLALMMNVDLYLQPSDARFVTNQPLYTAEGCLSLRRNF